SIAGSQSLDREAVIQFLADYGALVWIVGHTPLADQVRAASHTSSRKLKDAVECTYESKYGDLTLNLSNEHDWRLRTFTLIKGPLHQWKSGLVKDIQMGGGSMWPKGGVKKLVWTGTIDQDWEIGG